MFRATRRMQYVTSLVALLIVSHHCRSWGAETTEPIRRNHVWTVQEVELRAARDYGNPYTDVSVWVNLRGPDFSKRVCGFWDGGRCFKVRWVATGPGQWSWTSGSNQPSDTGLNGRQGSLSAIDWTDSEKQANPNRRGFLRATGNGHALQYADGTPFFLVGDTWWAASTWRLPLTGKLPADDYVPGPGICFEQAVAFRKRQGYNSVNVISAYPNWDADHLPNRYQDENGVTIRSGWEKFGVTVPGGKYTIKDMHDERGYRPFEMMPNRVPLSNFDRIVPQYFQSLDRKIEYLNDQGFIAMLETVRRDITPSWDAYFDFNTSFTRYVQYIAARYGAFNLIFSRIHLDAIPKNASLSANQFNEALAYHYKKYGPMPFGQPVTTLITQSTYIQFGHGEQCPWLTLHSQGNSPRDHGAYRNLEEMFSLDPPYPMVNLEPYYAGWQTRGNSPAGERPPADAPRDIYFVRAQMYGNVLSGALAGHVYGHAGYDMTTTGEPADAPDARPFFWDALNYRSGAQMQHLKKFVLSDGGRFQDLVLASDDLAPRKAAGSPENGLDGWGFMMRTPDKSFALLYFEHAARRATIRNVRSASKYQWIWYDPRDGKWGPPSTIISTEDGQLTMPQFPDAGNVADNDWAAKLIVIPDPD